jgi:NADPH:quinone reductase-like Zn-dependent oxidoreductase
VFVGGENGGDWTAGFGRQLGAFALAPFVKQRFIMLMNKEHYSGLERLAALVLEGKLRPLIDRRIGLAEVPDALRALEAGEVIGKVAIRVA